MVSDEKNRDWELGGDVNALNAHLILIDLGLTGCYVVAPRDGGRGSGKQRVEFEGGTRDERARDDRISIRLSRLYRIQISMMTRRDHGLHKESRWYFLACAQLCFVHWVGGFADEPMCVCIETPPDRM
jgi:hypothetical protein